MGLFSDPLSPEAPRELRFTPRGRVVYERPRPGDAAWEEREYLRKVAAVTSMAGFLRWAWPILHPGRPFEWGPHLDVVCWGLEQLAYGNIDGNELVICIPPRSLKSETVNVAFPAWIWLRAPWAQTLGLSGNIRNAVRDAKNMRKIVEHPAYQDLCAFAREYLGDYAPEGGPWKMAADQNQKAKFENTIGGTREALPAGGDVTGAGGDLLIIDDPIDAKDALEGGPDAIIARMAETITRYTGAWRSRLNDPKTGLRVTIMQRLHDSDLAGYLLSRGVASIVLPTEFNPLHPNLCPLDWRTEAGELLIEARVDRRIIDEMKAEDPLNYAAQHDQLPVPMGGGMFPPEAWAYYDDAPAAVWNRTKRAGGRCIASYDVANKIGEGNAATAIYLATRPLLSNKVQVIDEVYGQWELPGLDAEYQRIDRVWAPHVHVIEDAANGTSLLQLHKGRGRLHAIQPKEFGGKTVRAGYTQRRVSQGLLELPSSPAAQRWVGPLKEEHAKFPRGARMDRVDALSQVCMFFDVVDTTGADGAGNFSWLQSYGEGASARDLGFNPRRLFR